MADAPELPPNDQPSEAPPAPGRLARLAAIALRLPLVGRTIEHARGLAARIPWLGRGAAAARTFATRRPRISAAIGVGLVCLAVAGGWWLFGRERLPEFPPSKEAMEALEAEDATKARELAEAVRDHPRRTLEDDATAAFVLGMLASWEGDRTVGPERRQHFLVAARYLDESRKAGFPPNREADGWFYLGRSLHYAGQFDTARLALEQALPLNAERNARIQWLLAESYIRDSAQDYEQALRHNTAFLEIDNLVPAARIAGLLQRADILLGLKRADETRKVLAQLPPSHADRPQSLVVKGRLKMLEADQAEAAASGNEARMQRDALLQEAMELLRQAADVGRSDHETASEAAYLIGMCLLNSEQFEQALEQFRRTWRMFPRRQAAWAAEFRAADLARRLGRDDESLSLFGRVLSAIPSEDAFSNPWVTLQEVRRTVEEAYEAYRSSGKYKRCIELTDVMFSVFPASQVYQMQAEAHRQWGEALAAEAELASEDEVESLLAQARLQYRLAGDDFARLANIRVTTRFYTEDLWEAAESYLAGRCYSRANRTLREYLRHESTRRNSLALLKLGNCLLALGKYDEAITVLEECIEFHRRDAASYRARLSAAHAYQEKGEMERAEQLLRDNLSGNLAPTSVEWRDSLFALGRFLFLQEKYQEAVQRLEEAVLRYPHAPQTIDALYTLGECHRRLAERISMTVEKELVENVRLARGRRVSEHYLAALDYYRQAEEEYADKQDTAELSPLDRRTLRNAYFAEGIVLYRLGRFAEAVRAFTTITNRYQTDPAILEAYAQMARSYRAMNRPDQARVALEQAKIILDRIQPEFEFTQSTNYDQQQWAERLNWLSAL